jgi:hypothetical protein
MQGAFHAPIAARAYIYQGVQYPDIMVCVPAPFKGGRDRAGVVLLNFFTNGKKASDVGLLCFPFVNPAEYYLAAMIGMPDGDKTRYCLIYVCNGA